MLSTQLPSISALQAKFKADPRGPLMIASPCPFERRWIVQSLGISPRYLRASDVSLGALTLELETPSLFGGAEWIAYDEIEKVKQSMKDLACFSQLILMGSRAEKGPFITLDLTKEKPWEKKDRLRDFAIREMQRRGKQLAPDAAAYLAELVQGDLARLFQEVEKLSLFACDQPTVDLRTVQLLCVGALAVTGWTVSEKIALEGRCPKEVPFEDASGFHQLIGQLRYHFGVGMQLAKGEVVAGLRPKTAEKYKSLAQKRGEAYFHYGLEALFRTELKAKTTAIDPKVLFTHFIAEMHL